MPTRVVALWARMQGSLWFIPALITLAAALLALGTIRLDSTESLGQATGFSWVFGGGAEGARGVLSAIAGSIITVTGVVFSVTIVALQLASTQFTSRVLREFMADRANQVVLGVFIGTFIYTLLALRSVRSGAQDGSAFVPALSVTVAIVLSLVSMGFLIFFIDHIARAIQASTVIDQVANGARHSIETLFPESSEPAEESESGHSQPGLAQAAPVTASQAGYLTNQDEKALLDLARERDLTIRVEPLVGDFILPGAALALIWPASELGGDVEEAVRGAFIVGRERTADQDLGFQVAQLVDIAVKALSPGINDPRTAEMCIDRLGEILVALGNRGMPKAVETDEDGRYLLIRPRLTYGYYVERAFDKIRHYGADSPSIATQILRVLEQTTSLVPPATREPLVGAANQVLASSRRLIDDPHDLARVEKAASWLLGSAWEGSRPTRAA